MNKEYKNKMIVIDGLAINLLSLMPTKYGNIEKVHELLFKVYSIVNSHLS